MVDTLQRVKAPDWYRVKTDLEDVPPDELVEVGMDPSLAVDSLVRRFGSSEPFIFDWVYRILGSPVYLKENMIWILGGPFILIHVKGEVVMGDLVFDPGEIEVVKLRVGP